MPEALLMAAGLLCDGFIWQAVADRVAIRAEPQIVAFAGRTSIEAMARFALDEAPPRFALAGHSMGARVALEIVRQAPERVTRLALLNTGIHPVGAGEPEGRGRLVALAEADGMPALAAEWLPPMMGDGLGDDRLMARLTAMVGRQTPASFAGQIRALLNRPDAAAALAAVRVPTLLLTGSRDRWSPVAQHEAMRALLPAATLVVIEGAGHMAPVERPDAVAEALLRWMDKDA